MPHQCTNCGHTFPDGSKEMLSGCPECGGNKFQFHPDAAPADPEDAEPPERPDPDAGGVTSAVGKAAASVRDTLSRDSETPSARDAGSSADDAATGGSAADAGGVDADTGEAESGAGGTEPDMGGTEPDMGGTEPGADATGDAADTGDVASETRRGSEPSDAEAEREDAAHEDAAQADARTEMVESDDLPPKPERDGRVVKEPDSDDRPDMDELREELNSQFESIKVVAPGQYELNLMELYDREEYIIALQENGRYVIEVPESWRGDESEP